MSTPSDRDAALEQQDLPPSKSELKRQMEHLQKLGRQIIELSPEIRARLPLSDDMLAAVEEMGRIRANEARRRHMQYVGRVMRSEDIAGIEAAFLAMEQEEDLRNREFHLLEQTRDRLIAEGDDFAGEIMAQYPDIDRQLLRQLIRNARRERDAGKPPASARKLFRLLRDVSGL
ncbi:ribosome biogenesis factor YjgA [Zymobacter palmae]|uniref:Dual-action ribosomal maturation protein DarP n=1 Tax=Zymobacter palmae TaxID=33074 RepID=A0A348HGX3_9GAMM|nr:ribosome biogenesis factor YjgA [Zymobacter palmae]BBG30875.1 uncharacterized protein conserved in bacteria [Zymobacter palmae]